MNRSSSRNKDYDVIIIGGGITGAGTARDCAMRGLRVLLLERGDIATGATGRNHGLLHSGARYAVTDVESAAECIRENLILKRIASHCVDDTGGLFITLPEDDLSYQDVFVRKCRSAGIDAQVIDPLEAKVMEPSVNPSLIGAVKVPDGSVDPFRLCSSNMLDARLHGASIMLYTRVTAILKEGNRVVGVRAVDMHTGVEKEFHSEVTINACGIWGHEIAGMAGAEVGMFPAKGALLIFAHRVNSMVLNRCRKPSNADILVPGDTVCIIGTTSDRVPYEECDHLKVTPQEVDLLLSEGEKLAPGLASTRILRAYAGVRPLVSADNDPTGRNISRGIVCLDHLSRDGIEGFITITGGKLMTYRLMAEMAADMACSKLGVDASCTTAQVPLPGSSIGSAEETARKIWQTPDTLQKALAGRVGALAGKVKMDSGGDRSLVCECEEVSVGEVKSAIGRLNVHGLPDLRRRTRIGMGTCQGGLCGCRAACMLARSGFSTGQAMSDLKDFMVERWKGMYPIGWGETLRESAFSQWVYSEVLGMNDGK